MENFVVSARKYRPTTFQSVVGQSHITSTLKNAIARSQLAHAYLFCGPRGVGKTTCARIFAKAINCLDMTPDGEACNQCESCKSFNEGRSFNIHELDAASNNSVDDIRNLADQVRIPPQVGQYSVYIIDEVHMLSLQAFNAFLKTLEEPPVHAVFILATTEKHKIIPTILSRCQIYDFNRIRVEDTVEYLKYIASQEKIDYDDESLHVIAQKADGGMRDALSMFDKVVSFCGAKLAIAEVAGTLNVLDYDTYFRVTEHILAGDYTDALLLYDEVLRRGFSASTFVAGLNDHFRDLLMCKNPQTFSLLEVTGSVAQRYKVQSAETPVPLLFEGINLLTAVDGSLRAATNQRLHVELGLMKLCGLGQKKNNDTLTPSLPALKSTVATPKKEQTVEATSTRDTSADSSVESPPTPSAAPAAPTLQNDQISNPSLPSGVGSKENPSPSSVQIHHQEKTSPSLSGISISGASILSIMKSRPAAEPSLEESSENQTDAELVAPEEGHEAMLTRGCTLFARDLMEQRPRMGILFEGAEVVGNLIRLKVPNESSYDELMNNLSEMKVRLGELSGLRMAIEFDVTIESNTQGMKPIKVEDRLRYFTEKNPLLNRLRQELELDAE